MDFSKLEEMNLTRDEINRFGEALKDEKFRELLNEYAAEISNPENKRRYEEEITQLEKDRGTNVQFIHPEAHHALETRGAREKCFINICSDQLIDKPSCGAARGRDGKAGYSWRLPFSLTPGRPDRDAAGNRCVIYDVIFHPDALQAAENNKRLMEVIHSTAVGGIEDSFHIELDKSNIKQLKMKYKGVPQAAVIRRPIPGAQQQSTSDPEPEPEPKASCAAPPDPEDSTSSSNQPTKPHYTVKYRSVVDLQDYRCSRDSGPGARPREIVITVELPLLRSAQDAEVSVQERRLVLEAQKPAYKLDLTLSYPVDEDKGDAKFNKTKKQLTITLPVQPVRSTELHQIRCDEMKSSDEDDEDAADQIPRTPNQTELNCSIFTCDTAVLQHEPEHSFPLAPQLIDVTAEPQTLVNPAVNRTEPQTLVNPAVNRTEPQTLVNPAVNRTEPQTLVNPAVNRTEPQTLVNPAVNRTEPQTLVNPAVNRTEPQTLVNPAVNRTEPQTLVNPAVNRTEPQTLVNPAVNRTEPQEPDHLHLICSVEMNNEDGTNINPPVDSSSNTFSSESEIQTHVTATGRDEDIHEVSGALETENTQASESNTASDTNALFPHQPLTTDYNALINQQSSRSTNQQLNHEEDRSSSQDTEEPKTRRSSEDHESTAEDPAAANSVILREIEPHGRDLFICTHKTSAALCLQNSLWADLD